MIVISQNLVLSQLGTVKPNAPRIGYRTIATFDNITATYEEDIHPATEMTNVATNLWWRSTSTEDQYITVVAEGTERVDYIGLANHNFGSAGIAYRVQTSLDGSDWTDVTSPRIPESDEPIMHLFEEQFNSFYRIFLEPSDTPPRLAVFYIGKLLSIQRNIYVGHTPITMARDTSFLGNLSENGQFLGRVITSEFLSNAVELKNLTPSWYRTNFEPFAQQARYRPFFFAWRPQSYPREVGYVWAVDNIVPTNQRPNGMMQVSFKVQGISDFVATASNNSEPVSSS